MADNPADQATMERSARFYAEAIRFHRNHQTVDDIAAHTDRYAELDATLLEDSKLLEHRLRILSMKMNLYKDYYPEEMPAVEREGIFEDTARIIDDAMKLAAARSEHDALRILLKDKNGVYPPGGEGLRQADAALKDGDLFSKMDIPEGLRTWFGQTVLKQVIGTQYKERKDRNDGMQTQVTQNIPDMIRWSGAKDLEKLYRYDALIELYEKQKDDAAAREARETRNALARKLERESREIFNDQVANGVRSFGELLIWNRLNDNPTIGLPPVVEVPQPETAASVTENQPTTPAPIERTETETETETGTGTGTVEDPKDKPKKDEPKAGSTETDPEEAERARRAATPEQSRDIETASVIDVLANAETAIEILHKKGRELNPNNYDEAKAAPALEKFLQYFRMEIDLNQKVSRQDADRMESLNMAANAFFKAGGDPEKILSPEVLEDVFFSEPAPPSTADITDASKPGNTSDNEDTTNADKTGSGSEEDSTVETEGQERKPNTPIVEPPALDTFMRMTEALDTKEFAEQVKSEKRLNAGRMLELLDELLNVNAYDHTKAIDAMRGFVKSVEVAPGKTIDLDKPLDVDDPVDAQKMALLTKLALAYRMTNGDMKKVKAIFEPGADREFAVIEGASDRLMMAINPQYKEPPAPKSAGDSEDSDVNADSDTDAQAPEWYDDPELQAWAKLLGGTGAGLLALRWGWKKLKGSPAPKADTNTTTKTEESKAAGDKDAKTADNDKDEKAKDGKTAQKSAGDGEEQTDEKTGKTVGKKKKTQEAAVDDAADEGEPVRRTAKTGRTVDADDEQPQRTSRTAQAAYSAEVEALQRRLLESEQDRLKLKEKKLDKLKFEYEQKKAEISKLPTPSDSDKELLKMMKKNIRRKTEKLETLRRQTYALEASLESKPGAAAPHVTNASTAHSATVVQPPAMATIQPTPPPVVNPAAPQTTVASPSSAQTLPVDHELIPPTRLASDSPDVTQPVQNASTGNGAPKITPPPAATASQNTGEMHGPAPQSGSQATTVKAPEPPKPTPLEALTADMDDLQRQGPGGNFELRRIDEILDDRDFPRQPRPEPVRYANNFESLRERSRELKNDAQVLKMEEGLLEDKFREIEEKSARLRARANGSHVKTPQHEELDKLNKEYKELKREYGKKYKQHEGNVAKLNTDLEEYKQHRTALHTESLRLEDAQKALNKEFSDLEKNKNSLSHAEHEMKWRKLMEKRIKLHAEGMNHAEQHAAHIGAPFSSLSERPAAKRSWFNFWDKDSATPTQTTPGSGTTTAQTQGAPTGSTNGTPAPGSSTPQTPVSGSTTQTTLNAPPAGQTTSLLSSVKDSAANIRAAFNQTNLTRGFGVGGLGLGGYGLVHSIQDGDAVGITLNSANVLTGGAGTLQMFMASVPKPIAFIGTKLNIPLTIAMGGYQVYAEKGAFIDTNSDGTHSLGSKGSRTLAVAGTVTAGVITTAAGVAAAPAIVIVGGAAVVGETGVEMHRSYRAHEELGRLNKKAAEVSRNDSAEHEKSGAPSIRKYNNLTVFALGEAKKVNGTDQFEHVKNTNYSDQTTLLKLEQALNEQVAKLRKTIDQNTSIVPDWLRVAGGDGAHKKLDAESKLAPLEAAQKELALYKQDLIAYNEEHPQSASKSTHRGLAGSKGVPKGHFAHAAPDTTSEPVGVGGRDPSSRPKV